MMYAMFVGEMLIDGPTTRRITRIDIRAQTSEDLLTSLWEAMGEPSPKLSRKYVMVWGQEPGTGRSRVLNEFALALEQGPRANPMVKSYEEEGFKVEVVVEANKDLVLIAAHHKLFVSHSSEDHMRGFRDLVGTACSFQDLPVTFSDADRHASFGKMRAGGSGETACAGAVSAYDLEEEESVGIGAVAYLRSMWTLLWTAFLHPFTTTVVDLSTGKRLAELSVPFSQWEASFRRSEEERVNGQGSRESHS